jgi:hypothetical protein
MMLFTLLIDPENLEILDINEVDFKEIVEEESSLKDIFHYLSRSNTQISRSENFGNLNPYLLSCKPLKPISKFNFNPFLGSLNLEIDSQLYLYNSDQSKRHLLLKTGKVSFFHCFQEFNPGTILYLRRHNDCSFLKIKQT